ncbi:hypothetical protein L1049_023358 [Liquidambar formosana]|uniref:Uncharacterized protein n=1 Tax=Liquidambar formosana TaxID=63359 RepID=A0AAP0RUA5_LIQFO
MAFNRTLIQRLFNMPKISTPSLTNCRISSSSLSVKTLIPPSPDKTMAPDPGDNGFFRRFLHKMTLSPPAMDAGVPATPGR